MGGIKVWAFIILGIGVVILFIGDTLAGVGSAVDNLVASKWTGVALLGLGVVLLLGGSGSSLALKVEKAL